MLSLVKDQFPAVPPEPLHHQLALSIGRPYAPYFKTAGDCFECEGRAPITPFGFRSASLRTTSPGGRDAQVLRYAESIADESCYSSGLEDAIKMTAHSRRWTVERNMGSVAYG